MSVALALLAVDFFHYAPVIVYMEIAGVEELPYLRYSGVYDLILEMLLGFGTVMMVMDDVRHEVESKNRELRAARDRLEVLVRLDPMTEALNRHAFHSLLEEGRSHSRAGASGCVIVIDIDDLKPINDSFGHAVGDAAIREVAHAVRSVIRADDLLYRWGGDEFLILMFGLTSADASARINEIENRLSGVRLSHESGPVPVIVSYGMATFGAVSQIEKAIEEADSAMYSSKQSRKAGSKPSFSS
jgi:diguanylate cyclase (GGDEF)-like protein